MTLGGPATLLHIYEGRDRTFFFATFEGLRQSQANSFLGTVPTVLERQGDFSQTRDVNGNLIVIYDPHTTRLDPTAPAGTTRYIRTAYAGNVVPSTDFNAVGLNILKFYPLPNQPGQGASSVNNYFSDAPIVGNQNTIDTRVDHQESNRVPAGSGQSPTPLGFNPNVSAGLRALNFPSVTSVTRSSGLGPTSGLEADFALPQPTVTVIPTSHGTPSAGSEHQWCSQTGEDQLQRAVVFGCPAGIAGELRSYRRVRRKPRTPSVCTGELQSAARLRPCTGIAAPGTGSESILE